MTPTELNWFVNVAAKVSALQQDPAFATEIALEMLDGKSPEEAQTVASQALWQRTLDRAITSKDFGLEQPAAVIDTEVVPEYDKENGREVGENGAEETNQGILLRRYSMGDSGGSAEAAGTFRDVDSVLPGEGISEGTGEETVWISGSEGITDYDDDFDHFDGKVRKDTEGKSVSEESAKCLLGTTVIDNSGAPIAVYHGTPEMDFATFEKGDTGFHFGSYEQATKRLGEKSNGSGRIFRTYLNIQKPLYVSSDIGRWDALPFAMYLRGEQVLTDAEYADVYSLWESDTRYNSPAAMRLRKILTGKGYDGVVYSANILWKWSGCHGKYSGWTSHSDESMEGKIIIMLNMTDKTKDFLSKNLPDALVSDDIGDVLWMLYDLIDEKGFAPPHYESYNEFGREAQKAYDDLYYSN